LIVRRQHPLSGSRIRHLGIVGWQFSDLLRSAHQEQPYCGSGALAD
jgi:hypothetical protein